MKRKAVFVAIVVLLGSALALMRWQGVEHPAQPSSNGVPDRDEHEAGRPSSASSARDPGLGATEESDRTVEPEGRVAVQVEARPGATSDQTEAGAKQPEVDSEALADAEYRRIGHTPEIDPQNPAARPIIEALAQGGHPERLSIAHPPKPFDAQDFQDNPEGYLELVEPGRVFQILEPAEGIPRLRAAAPSRQEVLQGGEVELAVQAVPGAPVSFASLDLGIFAENGLSAISVRADEGGIARVHLRALPGTVGEVSTLVGSPMCSGQIRFLTTVLLPEVAED